MLIPLHFSVEDLRTALCARLSSEEKIPAYRWQDNLPRIIASSKGAHQQSFIVDIASTGAGKTIANAKILAALCPEGFRATITNGVRILTPEFTRDIVEYTGIAPADAQVLLGASENPEDKAPRYLRPPILYASTAHLKPALNGDSFAIARMQSADLVVDEFDSVLFDFVDLGRLVEMAGAYGRNVIISSATLLPEIAQHFFKMFCKGAAKNGTQRIFCGWCDEYTAKANWLRTGAHHAFEIAHKFFVQERIQNLNSLPVYRKGFIENVDDTMFLPNAFTVSIKSAIHRLHRDNHNVDAKTGKRISFGAVRFVGTAYLYKIGKMLVQEEAWSGADVHFVVFSCQHPWIERQRIERFIKDATDTRYGRNRMDFPATRALIDASSSQDVIFVALTSAIEDFGIDNDFDWGVLEPTSIHSIIQFSGRVNRRNPKPVAKPNIAVLQKNVNAVKGRRISFVDPGYETNQVRLTSHDMKELVDDEFLSKIDSRARISDSPSACAFAKMEHAVTKAVLAGLPVDQDQGPRQKTGRSPVASESSVSLSVSYICGTLYGSYFNPKTGRWGNLQELAGFKSFCHDTDDLRKHLWFCPSLADIEASEKEVSLRTIHQGQTQTTPLAWLNATSGTVMFSDVFGIVVY